MEASSHQPKGATVPVALPVQVPAPRGSEDLGTSERYRLYLGDALAVLPKLATASVDAVITDPPYSSGGTYSAQRTTLSTRRKYVSSGAGHSLPDFPGDNRDQRSYGYWCSLWLGECLRVCRPGGVCLVFTDWRQLPTVTDALQAGGWTWRGIVPWAKPAARPQLGRFTAQCEYIVWGSAGRMDPQSNRVTLPGFYQFAPPRRREHITQKPLELLRALVKIVPAGATILDPFVGSGTTGVASLEEKRRIIGIELSDDYSLLVRRSWRLAGRSVIPPSSARASRQKSSTD